MGGKGGRLTGYEEDLFLVAYQTVPDALDVAWGVEEGLEMLVPGAQRA